MPKLSVTIIAKNEERNLPRALASVRDVADEVIVTDTGSTDRTVEIARDFGARVAHFDWIDDFSAAHNYCNRLASGDWLLMLDCDEELLDAGRDQLERCFSDDRALAFGVLRQDLYDEQQPKHFSEMWQVRLYRNRPDLEFVARFHHHLSPRTLAAAQAEGLEIRESKLRMRHYGYVAASRPDKDRRAVRLLALELADRPGQFYYLVELGLTQVALGEKSGIDALVEAARMAVAGDPSVAAARGQYAMLLEFVLGCPHLPTDFPLSRSQARAIVQEQFARSIPLLWRIAQDEYRVGRFAACARLLERVTSLGANGQYDHTTSFDPAIMLDDARLNLGACYVRLGKLNAAEKTFSALLDSPSRGQQAAENLKAIRRIQR